MDILSFYDIKGSDISLNSKYEKSGPCHRSQSDIVIPQLIVRGLEVYQTFYETKIPYRQFDSTFSGSTWGQRKPLEEMAENAVTDYNERGLDKFSFCLNSKLDLSLIYRGYFMWAPCGKC